MLITREMDYAIRILRALARKSPRTSPQIAEAEHMPQAITYKVLKKLSKAGIVKANRGHVGGYTLQKSCADLTLYDLFYAMEDSLFITECLADGYDCANNSCGMCRVHSEFRRIQHALDSEMKQKSLEELFAPVFPSENATI